MSAPSQPHRVEAAEARRVSASRRAVGRLAAEAAGAGLLAAALGLGAVTLAAGFPDLPRARAVTLNLGPNDAGHVAGFARPHEVDAAGGTHWTGPRARVRIPLAATGEATLGLRFARVLPQPARVGVRLGDRPVDAFVARGGQYVVQRTGLGRLHGAALELGLDVEERDERGLGLRLDWASVQLAPGGVFALAPRERALLALFTGALFAALRLAGFGRAATLAATLTLGSLAAAAELAWPFVLAHVAGKLALPGAVGAGLAAAAMRGRPGGRWAVLIFVAGYLCKGAGVFHPDYYYPDVHLFSRYVEALAGAEGSFTERGVAAQKEVNAAYPRFFAGQAYAFPYSPVFFLPFTAFGNRDLVQDAQRHVGLASAAADVLLAFWLAGLAFGPRAGPPAALVAALLPALYSRVLYAMWPTLTGHVLDLFAILASHAALAGQVNLQRLTRSGAAILAALLVYVSSLLNLGAYFLALAALTRSAGARVLAIYAAAATLTVSLLYGPFLRQLFGEIVPALLAGARMEKHSGLPDGGLLPAVARMPLFFGWGGLALAAAGLVLLLRRPRTPAGQVLTAYVLAVALLVGLRAFGAGLFRDLKEITFAAPLVAALAAAPLEALWSRGRSARVLAVLIVMGLGLVCAERYGHYWNTYRSPAMLPAGAP